MSFIIPRIVLTGSDSQSESGLWLWSCASATAAVAAAGYWSSRLRGGGSGERRVLAYESLSWLGAVSISNWKLYSFRVIFTCTGKGLYWWGWLRSL